MKVLVSILLTVVTWLGAWAQEGFCVTSFQKLDWDLDARTIHPMIDQNGKKAALIKVNTVETDFDFDVGMMGVVAVKQEIGEIWVYVPEKVQHITIRHKKFGVIRNYKFEIPVESAVVYELVLNTPPPESPTQTIILKEVKSQEPVLKSSTEQAVSSVVKEKKSWFFANFAMGVVPELSYGFLAGWRSPSVGCFVKMRTSKKSPETAFFCTSDGKLSDGNPLWTSGESATSRFSASAGVVAKIWKPVNIYLGAGYGTRKEAWQDIEGAWGEVTDRTFKGVSADMGILLMLNNHLSIHVGITTTQFKYLDAEAGFGVNF